MHYENEVLIIKRIKLFNDVNKIQKLFLLPFLQSIFIVIYSLIIKKNVM